MQRRCVPRLIRLDNNSMTATIAASSSKLYQLHRNGVVWEYTGVPCQGAPCPGWRRLDNNPRTRAIVAVGSALFQLHGSSVGQKHSDGRIWQSTGAPCVNNSCPGWDMLDNNPRTVQIKSDRGHLFQLHNTFRIGALRMYRVRAKAVLAGRCSTTTPAAAA